MAGRSIADRRKLAVRLRAGGRLPAIPVNSARWRSCWCLRHCLKGGASPRPYSVLPFAAYPSSSSNALCSARTASRICFSSIRQVMRISLVVISSILIPASKSVRNMRPA